MATSDNFMWFPEKSEKIAGETTDYAFSKLNAFEVFSFTFNMTASEGTEGGKAGGSSAGKAKFGSFSIEKYIDTASVPLYKACSKGKVFPTIMLAVRQAGGSHLNYLQYIFRYNQVTGITWSGGSGSERPKETMVFSFKAMGVQYIQQLANGSEGSKQQWSWSTADQTSTLDIKDSAGSSLPPAPSFLPGTTG